MSLLDNFPHTIDLARATYSVGGYGGDKHTLTSFITGEAAWVQVASQKEIAEFAKKDQDVSHKIYLRRDPGLQLDDDILVHGGPYDGKHLKAKSWADATAGLGYAWKLFASLNRESQA